MGSFQTKSAVGRFAINTGGELSPLFPKMSIRRDNENNDMQIVDSEKVIRALVAMF